DRLQFDALYPLRRIVPQGRLAYLGLAAHQHRVVSTVAEVDQGLALQHTDHLPSPPPGHRREPGAQTRGDGLAWRRIVFGLAITLPNSATLVKTIELLRPSPFAITTSESEVSRSGEIGM